MCKSVQEHILKWRLERARKLLGELPEEIKDPYLEKEFLSLLDDVITNHGKAWVKENSVSIRSAWEYIRTLV
jgi:hypothetical protein